MVGGCPPPAIPPCAALVAGGLAGAAAFGIVDAAPPLGGAGAVPGADADADPLAGAAAAPITGESAC